MSVALIILQSKPIPKDLKEIEVINIVQLEGDTSVKRKGKVREIQSFEDFKLLLGSIRVQWHLRADPHNSRDRAKNKIDNFCEMLKGPVREAYDLAKSVVGDASKTTMQQRWLSTTSSRCWLDADAYQHQLAYISRVKKPTSLNDELLSVNMFHQRIQVI
jgi:hypothetical protein